MDNMTVLLTPIITAFCNAQCGSISKVRVSKGMFLLTEAIPIIPVKLVYSMNTYADSG